MKHVIKFIAILFILLSIGIYVVPEMIFNTIGKYTHYPSIYLIAIIGRLLFGILLIVCAKESTSPLVIKIIGVFSILAGILFLSIGQKGFVDVIGTVISYAREMRFISCLFGFLLGSFIYFTFSQPVEKKLE